AKGLGVQSGRGSELPGVVGEQGEVQSLGRVLRLVVAAEYGRESWGQGGLTLDVGQLGGDPWGQARVVPGPLAGAGGEVDRLAVSTDPAECRTELERGLPDGLAIEADGLAELGDRVRDLPLGTQDHAEVVVGGGEVGLEPDGRTVLGDGLRQLALG